MPPVGSPASSYNVFAAYPASLPASLPGVTLEQRRHPASAGDGPALVVGSLGQASFAAMLGVKSGDYVHAVGGVPSISLAHFTDQCDEASGRAQGSWKYFVVTFTKATNGAHLDVHFIIGKPLGFHLKECYGPIVAVALEPSSAPSVAGVMPFARVVALDGDRLGRSLADGSFGDGSLERFTRACDSRMQDNVPFFVTFQDVTTEAARLEVEAKARADLSTGTGDQNNKDGSTQRLLPPLRPPTGWPLSERPPDLARVPPGWWQRWPAISNAPPGWKDPAS